MDKKRNEIENPNKATNIPQRTRHACTNTYNYSEERLKTDSSNSYDRTILSSRLKEAIVNHRRNSTTFEYSPTAESADNSNIGATPWGESSVENRSAMSNIVSELIKKLEKTNKLRQSLKVNGSQKDMLQNITQRKKPLQVTCSENVKDFKSSHSLNSHSEFSVIHDYTSKDDELPNDKSFQQSVNQREIGFVVDDFSKLLVDQSSQYSPPENEIGFILNDSVASSTILLRRNKADLESIAVSPPSIGFILDNLDETALNSRGSSLFSDIDSDVGSPAQNANDNTIYTEDESLFGKSDKNKLSSSESLDPYVSCVAEDTREWSSKEEHYVSCMDTPPCTNESVSSKHDQIISINSTSDFGCDFDYDKSETPVNPTLVTSTPERLCEYSTCLFCHLIFKQE